MSSTEGYIARKKRREALLLKIDPTFSLRQRVNQELTETELKAQENTYEITLDEIFSFEGVLSTKPQKNKSNQAN